MEIKYSLEGAFLYAAMLLYLSAFVASILRRVEAGRRLFCTGFITTVITVLVRWYMVRHIPMQNLYEVFLVMGAAMYSLSCFCRRILRIGADAADMLIGVIVLGPAGFFFSAEPNQLPPALQCWLFAPHVAVYLLAYILMTKAAVQAVCQLMQVTNDRDMPRPDYERGTYRMIAFGFPLMTTGLVLGSWWGHLAWGDF